MSGPSGAPPRGKFLAHYQAGLASQVCELDVQPVSLHFPLLSLSLLRGRAGTNFLNFLLRWPPPTTNPTSPSPPTAKIPNTPNTKKPGIC